MPARADKAPAGLLGKYVRKRDSQEGHFELESGQRFSFSFWPGGFAARAGQGTYEVHGKGEAITLLFEEFGRVRPKTGVIGLDGSIDFGDAFGGEGEVWVRQG
jgi:hypothetical protein